MSKRKYSEELLEEGYKMYTESSPRISVMEVARRLKRKYPDQIDISADNFRRATLSRYIARKTSDNHPSLAQYCEENGIPIEQVKNYWHKGKHHSVHVNSTEIITYEDVRDDFIEQMQAHAPEHSRVFRQSAIVDATDDHSVLAPHCLVVSPADVHIGKLSQAIRREADYNVSVAVDRVFAGVRGLLHKASGYNIDQIVLVMGNDVLHTDNPRGGTTKGTPMDTDGMWYENWKIAKQLYIDIIAQLVEVADVHVMYNPSNHDYMSGFFLSDCVSTWYHRHPQVTFDVEIAHRKYYLYGNSLIGTEHGDGAKPERLPLLMAEDVPEKWVESAHRYFYLHHLHHKASKDHGSVNVEYLRSPSGTDLWHHVNGFEHQPKAIEGFLHCKKHGQVARLTHIF